MSEAIWRVAQSVGFDDYELRPMLEAFAAALSKPAPSPQPAAPVVSAEQIEDLAWLDVDEHGEIDRSSDHNKMMTAPQRCAFKRGARAILALRPQPVPMTPEQQPNPFSKRCYTMSESHLSGYRLIVGFEHLEDAQDAHTFVANTGRRHGITAKAEGGA